MNHFFRYSACEWRQWLQGMDANAATEQLGGWTIKEWVEWVDVTESNMKSLDRLPKGQPKKRDSTSLLQEKPAQVQFTHRSNATSSSQVPPAQGQNDAFSSTFSPTKIQLILVGRNGTERKKYHSDLRQVMKRRCVDRNAVTFQSSASCMPMPEICNRVATSWKERDGPCQCHLWPAWQAKYMGTKCRLGGVCTDVDGRTKELSRFEKVCYWRQGQERKRWWYDGVVSEVLTVRCPSGQVKVIVGVN